MQKKHWGFGRPGIKSNIEFWDDFFVEAPQSIANVIPIHHVINKMRGRLQR
jgi:hypothetical protein